MNAQRTWPLLLTQVGLWLTLSAASQSIISDAGPLNRPAAGAPTAKPAAHLAIAEAEFINLERLSERVLLAYWVGTDRRCNLTVIQTAKGLVLVDSEMSPRIMAPIRARIEQVLGRRDWLYVIDTHAHDSHAGGNSLFKEATIVGHTNLAQDMRWIERRQTEPGWKQRELDRADQLMRTLREWLPRIAQNAPLTRLTRGEIKFWELFTQDLRQGYEVVRPTRTFTDSLRLDCGDLELEAVFFGKSHSLSDTLVYVPQEHLLITGGIAYQRAHIPEIGERTTLEDLHRFLAVLDRFLAPEARIDHVVPSHSPPLLKNDLAPIRDYYRRMLAGVSAARSAGLTYEQTKARWALAKNFPALRDTPPGSWSHGMHDRNLRNLWRLVGKEPLPNHPAAPEAPSE